MIADPRGPEPGNGAPPPAPRWVKAFAVVIVIPRFRRATPNRKQPREPPLPVMVQRCGFTLTALGHLQADDRHCYERDPLPPLQ
jgi:hypothetical protein